MFRSSQVRILRDVLVGFACNGSEKTECQIVMKRSRELYGRSAPLVHRKPDILLQEGDRLSFGTLTLEVLYTPGHTPGGVCLVSRPYCVFSGDTLFHRRIGRTDLDGGDYDQIISSIREKLYTLEDDLVVFPGHGSPTTIIEEKYENPFITVEE